MLIPSVPLMVIEEVWNGHPLIDAHGGGWIPFAVVVPVIFCAGGFVAGRPQNGKGSAAGAGLVTGLLAVGVLISADLVRRLAVAGDGLPFRIFRLWIVAGGGAIILAGLGAWSSAVVPRLQKIRSSDGASDPNLTGSKKPSTAVQIPANPGALDEH
jgi:hypothetical protein